MFVIYIAFNLIENLGYFHHQGKMAVVESILLSCVTAEKNLGNSF